MHEFTIHAQIKMIILYPVAANRYNQENMGVRKKLWYKAGGGKKQHVQGEQQYRS